MPLSLVTGAAGFIGAHVTDSLLDLGHEVVAVDDLSGGFRENVPTKAAFVEGDVSRPEVVDGLFGRHRFDYVFHLAAYAAEGLSHFIRRFNYTNNLTASVNLINASVNGGVKRFVFTSSIAVYGHAKPPMTEATIPVPADPYGIAKYAVEQDLRAAHEMFGLEYAIFRPHNVYGERQNIGDKYRNVVGIFMNQLLQGLPLPIFGDGEQQRAFSYIADVAPFIARAAELDGARNEVFNVGADEPASVNRLGELVSRAFGQPFQPRYLPARNEVVHAWADHEKVRRVFGAGAPVSLEEGIERMGAWVRRTGARQSKNFDGVEIEKNLPPSWRATAGA
jgi:UDP-glucose 4-epimerase